MVYSINNVNLMNPALGWYLRPSAQPFAGVEADISSVAVTGVDGARTGVWSLGSPTLTLVVNTDQAGLPALNALFAQPSLTLRKVSDPSRYAVVSLLSSHVSKVYPPAAKYIDMTYIVQIDGTYWKDQTVTETTAAAISTSPQVVGGLFPGLSGVINDCYIRVRGAFAGLRVEDTSGAWFTYDGSLTTSQYLRFYLASGRAWITTTATWTGGTEVSGGIDYGGPRDVFEITPRWSANPGTRDAQLTITTTSRSGAQVQLYGRGAHIV